ncbi:MAG: cyclase family protein [Candidatus Micrarchaeales archaeon]|jgi:Predicted metal-dependent hydrolase|uniref:Cyclase family protein n=1 Tax=Candidatus Micrarchaeum acidiphilum ARMAN-2 TaxID=425595 RepID=C7DH55_MICA2|nr:MAG: cyclase family protein [Candidatus Micrarchaeum acidiphilum ARMAN-2]MCW6161387.1 cyclase family protein [Candidatus Micrarchaeales archaeon]
MEIYDISMPIDASMLVFPGNPKPSIKRYSSIPKRLANESLVEVGSHTGTHFDAGLHALKNGWSSGSVPLESFFGKAAVVDLTGAGKIIGREQLVGKGIRRGMIVLLKTENSLFGYRKFRKDFASLGISGARYLVERGVKAVGIDYLSIERFGSDMSVHRMLLRKRIPIIEGLMLGKVAPGSYNFVGLPIKVDIDAALMRAVLLK